MRHRMKLINQIAILTWIICSVCSQNPSPGNQSDPMFHGSSLPAGISSALRYSDQAHSQCGRNVLDIREITIGTIQKKFATKKLSSEQLTACYLERILALDPYLKAVIEVNPDALEIARKADVERNLGTHSYSELHGIPVLIKDIIGTRDQMQTTVGTVALEWVLPKKDSEVIKKLRAAGAVIIGKSNPAEWAYFRGLNIPPGWSGRGGQTLNPYVLTFDPSESSTGSAVGTASNLAVVAVGSETDSSIMAPCSVGSLVGLKPTVGCVPTGGVIPISFTQDTLGPMARTVKDAMILYNSIATDKCKVNTDFDPTAKWRIGVLREPFWDMTDVLLREHIPYLEVALKRMVTSGVVTVIDPVIGNANSLKKVTPEAGEDGVNHYLKHAVRHQEVSHNRNRMSQLSDVIKFNMAHPAPEGYDQDVLILSEATDGLGNTTYKRLRHQNLKFSRKYIDEIINTYNLDAIAAPCYRADKKLLKRFLNVGAVAGYPHIAVPAGIADNGVPIGLCFGGKPYTEAKLFQIARVLEIYHPQRSQPKFKFNN